MVLLAVSFVVVVAALAQVEAGAVGTGKSQYASQSLYVPSNTFLGSGVACLCTIHFCHLRCPLCPTRILILQQDPTAGLSPTFVAARRAVLQ